MRKRHLLAATVAAASVALLAACGASDGPALQFDATAYQAAESQPADTSDAEDVVSLNTTPQTEVSGEEDAPATPLAAEVDSPAHIGDTAWNGYASHDSIVQFANSVVLSSSRTTHPMEAGWSHEPSLVSSSVGAQAESPSVVAADSDPVTESSVVSAVSTGVKPASGTPEAVLQNASFTLVTVETDGGEQVILMPSEDYTKVCPHRLRMGSEFSDIDFAEF